MPCINLWNKFSKPCLDSIFNSQLDENIKVDTLLISNNSTDETNEECVKLSAQRKDFLHLRNSERWGCQKSWNYGLNYAKDKGYDYTIVINNDILFHPKCIKNLVERISKGDVIMVTAMDVRGQMPPENLFTAPESQLPESEGPNFSAYMVRNDIFLDKIGEADEAFAPAYFEDNDIHYRIRKAGEKAIVYPPAMFYHFGSQTQNSVPGGMCNGIMFHKNRNYYISKWGGIPSQERFSNPFNDSNKTIKWTQQNQK